MSGVETITLGCRLNLAESDTMRRLAGGSDDLVIVNSCAVTSEAVRQTRQAIRRAKRARPGARVLVTGCAAQIDPRAFAAMPEVWRVVSNARKLEADSFTREDQLPSPAQAEPVEALPFSSVREEETAGLRQAQAERVGVGVDRVPVATAFDGRSRAFVEVQNGCDHRCTFCIIPLGRGASRSVPAGRVVERIQQLVDQGAREVVLTGVDVTSYGPDLPGAPTLGHLVERVLTHVPALPRLRLSSLDCIEIDPRLEEIIAGEPRFMPHLHMSFQSGDDMILKRMKRRHSRAQAVALVNRLKARRPELAIGADLIAGFPTETDEMAENSRSLIDECDIVMGHIFPYSPRPGTPAARMPQVAPALIRARAARLREACVERREAWLRGMVGTEQRVLMEKSGTGHTENFAPVKFNRHPRGSGDPASSANEEQRDSRFRGNDVVIVCITGVENGALIGAAA